MDEADKTVCAMHKNKKVLFCENCCLSLCVKCKDKHARNHEIRFLEETAEFVTIKFKQGQTEI